MNLYSTELEERNRLRSLRILQNGLALTLLYETAWKKRYFELAETLSGLKTHITQFERTTGEEKFAKFANSSGIPRLYS